MLNLAVFISPHGFGHAARTCAVLESLSQRIQNIHYHIYTRTPDWFFKDSLPNNFTYHSFLSDVGLVQTSALSENLPVTLRTLDEYIPFPEYRLAELSAELKALNCCVTLSDIAPLGIEVARQADIPSILIENFTWDWIYYNYTQEHPEFERFIDLLSPVFLSAIYHIQAQPYCANWHTPSISVPPISRAPRQSRRNTRHQLSISSTEKLILVTLGGIRGKLEYLEHLPDLPGIRYVIPGAARYFSKYRNQIHLPFHTPMFHPDLVFASDAVIGKAGYSTLAEAYYAGVPFGFIPRTGFRESPILEDFIEKNLHGVHMDEDTFFNGNWENTLDHLLANQVEPVLKRNGADLAAEFIANLLKDHIKD